jgi:hypothetical protein
MLVMGDLVAALFFLRFWFRTGDQLFGSFGVAFLVLAVHWMLLANYSPGSEPTWIIGLRLVGFLIILAAIVGKNILPPRRVG